MATYTFAAQIDAFIEKTKLRADIVLRKLAFDAFAGLLQRSPVDTGRFRGAWRIGLNQKNFETASVSASKGQDPPNSAEQAYAATVIGAASFGDTIYITNSVPYAEALEGGWSKQAPGQGAILKRTFVALQHDFQAALNSVRNS